MRAWSPASLVRAKAVAAPPVDADRRHLHHAPHARLLAGGEQGGGAVGVNSGRRVPGAVLQHAGAVHHRVDAGQMRQPVGGAGGLGDVERDAACRLRQSGGGAGAAGNRHHRVPLAGEAGQHGSTDQAGRPRQQHAQAALLVAGPQPGPFAHSSCVIPAIAPRLVHRASLGWRNSSNVPGATSAIGSPSSGGSNGACGRGGYATRDVGTQGR